jgi:anti-sigma regulatory factor (Ser/Thr protein kinase)
MVGGAQRVVTNLPANPSAVPAARRFAAQAMSHMGIHGETMDRTQLLVTELATNAVQHAHSAIRLSVVPDPGRVRVEVRDDDPSVPPAPRKPDADAEHGRGLWLVSALSERWGVNANDKGKTVWFEVN